MMAIDGVVTAAVLNSKSGQYLAQIESQGQTETPFAAGTSAETVRAMTELGRILTGSDHLEDLLVTSQVQCQIIRPLQGKMPEGLFLLLVLKRSANSDDIAFARYRLMHTVQALSEAGPDPAGTQKLGVRRLRARNYSSDMGRGAPGYRYGAV
ncbi:MAG: hypothetical protein H7Z41_10130 [Cytophagales bacterium]|nr:hypothetical protein [Armatimonadota bacterium]